jgi:SAM-dependent methyltransferase
MDPLIKEGDLVFVEPAGKETIMRGDILAYKTGDNETVIAHRLIKIIDSEHGVSYVLDGDFADGAADVILFKDILGKVVGFKSADKLINLETRCARAVKRLWHNFPMLGLLCLPLLKWRSLCFKIDLLINPRFFIKPPLESLRIVRDKFDQPEEVQFHSEYVNFGLEDWEEAVVKKYLKKGGRILNIGCGAGREAIALAKFGFEVTAVDISPAMVQQAKKNAQDSGLTVKFQVTCASEVSFPKDSFDYCLFSRNVYSFIPSRCLRVKSLSRVKKCLNSQGIVFLSPYIITRKLFSGATLLDTARRIRNFILPFVFLSEPGDTWMRGVSEVSRLDKFCFCHFFRSEKEVLREIKKAGLKSVDSGIENIFMAKMID